MNPTDLLAALHTAERLKDTTRHCCTSHRRPESVAEHSWRIALMAFWLRDEFPQADMDRVIRMCLIHDGGVLHRRYPHLPQSGGGRGTGGAAAA